MKIILAVVALAAIVAAFTYSRTQSVENLGVTDIELIQQGEGLRLCTYKDTMGIKTTCYGFNL